MGKDDSSTLMLGAMCWLLGEEKAKKLARSVGRVSKEYKRTLNELKIDITEPPMKVPDMARMARSLAIDTEDKSKKEILAEIKGKVMDGRYDCLVDPFEDHEEYVPTSSSEEPSSEEPSEEESTKQVQ